MFAGQVFGPLEFSRRDLAALNIQRARDHGLTDYQTIRETFGLPRLNSWQEINTQNSLTQQVIGSNLHLLIFSKNLQMWLIVQLSYKHWWYFYHYGIFYDSFSSPELKLQVSYFDGVFSFCVLNIFAFFTYCISKIFLASYI